MFLFSTGICGSDLLSCAIEDGILSSFLMVSTWEKFLILLFGILDTGSLHLGCVYPLSSLGSHGLGCGGSQSLLVSSCELSLAEELPGPSFRFLHILSQFTRVCFNSGLSLDTSVCISTYLAACGFSTCCCCSSQALWHLLYLLWSQAHPPRGACPMKESSLVLQTWLGVSFPEECHLALPILWKDVLWGNSKELTVHFFFSN